MGMPRRHGWLGVDLGADAVKIAQLERRGQATRLVRAAVVHRDQPWDTGIGPDTPAAPSERELGIALALAGGPIGGNESACVLSMRLYDLRSLHVAQGPQAANVVREELAAVYGGVEDRIHDFWSTQTETARPNSENVSALTLSKDWAEQVCDDLEGAGLYGEVIDGPPLALARAARLAEAGQQPTLLIDWGFNRATVSVIRREQPLFVRCLRDSGYRNVIEHVGKALGLNAREAEKVLGDFGLPESPQGDGEDLQHAIADIIAEPLRAIADELHRTLSYVKMHRRGNEPEIAYLFGGGATLRNADRFIERTVAIRTSTYLLNGQSHFESESGRFPIAMLGAAIGLSSLAWRA